MADLYDPAHPPALRVVLRDDALVLQLRCPKCGRWGDIDDDQLHGRISVDHTDRRCGYHETHDFAVEAIWMETDTSRRHGWGAWAEPRAGGAQ